jgi:hydrogenase maturation protease
MNSGLVDKIVNAVLYEGYLLYPYRASAVKNNQRWNFGVVYPRAYAEAQLGSDSWTMQTECPVTGGPSVSLDAKVRFLRIVDRTGGSAAAWQEAAECDVTLPRVQIGELTAQPLRHLFALPAESATEGEITRTQQAIDGLVEVSAVRAQDGLFLIRVCISNLTAFHGEHRESREQALPLSFASTHTILTVNDGEFVSMIDPLEAFRNAVAQCQNVGTWPVLVGAAGVRDTMLSSPIILYDYPEIAPESPGDLFEGTEIDEILSLRILTMTDEEKSEMQGLDDRSRRILERTENLPAEHFMKMHGVLRALDPMKADTR